MRATALLRIVTPFKTWTGAILIMATNGEQRDLRYVVLGAGMAGILASIKLLQAGVTDVTIYETSCEYV